MTKQSLVPVGTERAVTRRAANPFTFLQHEIDRLFDGYSRSFPLSPCRRRPCRAWT